MRKRPEPVEISGWQEFLASLSGGRDDHVRFARKWSGGPAMPCPSDGDVSVETGGRDVDATGVGGDRRFGR